jgi:hypothetical protein
LLAFVQSTKIVSYELRKVSCMEFVYADKYEHLGEFRAENDYSSASVLTEQQPTAHLGVLRSSDEISLAHVALYRKSN